MCTDLRLAQLTDLHISGRTMDAGHELRSRVQVVPAGQQWSATATESAVEPLRWTNAHGYVAVDAFGFDGIALDGLNDAGLSVAALWLPETDLTSIAPMYGDEPAIDLINVGAWLLGTCSTTDDVREAFGGVRLWNAPASRLWSADFPIPNELSHLLTFAFPLHLAVHDARGRDMVVEFLGGEAVFHSDPSGVLTNSPTFDWHATNLRNYLNLRDAQARPVDLMGKQVLRSGDGTGLLGLPGDVTPPSRFVRAAALAALFRETPDARAAVNQVFHILDLVKVPRGVARAGDYTQWCVARDHDALVYYVRSYDGWTTDVHDLKALRVSDPLTPRRALRLPVD